jgi:hypothetical protein
MWPGMLNKPNHSLDSHLEELIPLVIIFVLIGMILIIVTNKPNTANTTMNITTMDTNPSVDSNQYIYPVQ